MRYIHVIYKDIPQGIHYSEYKIPILKKEILILKMYCTYYKFGKNKADINFREYLPLETF